VRKDISSPGLSVKSATKIDRSKDEIIRNAGEKANSNRELKNGGGLAMAVWHLENKKTIKT